MRLFVKLVVRLSLKQLETYIGKLLLELSVKLLLKLSVKLLLKLSVKLLLKLSVKLLLKLSVNLLLKLPVKLLLKLSVKHTPGTQESVLAKICNTHLHLIRIMFSTFIG